MLRLTNTLISPNLAHFVACFYIYGKWPIVGTLFGELSDVVLMETS